MNRGRSKRRTETRRHVPFLVSLGVIGGLTGALLLMGVGMSGARTREWIEISSPEEWEQYLLDEDSPDYDLGGRYRLTADLDLTGCSWPIGSNYHPFTGRMDGDGHVVEGLDRPMFGVTKGAKIENLLLDQCSIRHPYTYYDGEKAVDGYAALIAYAVDTEITSCGTVGELYIDTPQPAMLMLDSDDTVTATPSEAGKATPSDAGKAAPDATEAEPSDVENEADLETKPGTYETGAQDETTEQKTEQPETEESTASNDIVIEETKIEETKAVEETEKPRLPEKETETHKENRAQKQTDSVSDKVEKHEVEDELVPLAYSPVRSFATGRERSFYAMGRMESGVMTVASIGGGSSAGDHSGSGGSSSTGADSGSGNSSGSEGNSGTGGGAGSGDNSSSGSGSDSGDSSSTGGDSGSEGSSNSGSGSGSGDSSNSGSGSGSGDSSNTGGGSSSGDSSGSEGSSGGGNSSGTEGGSGNGDNNSTDEGAGSGDSGTGDNTGSGDSTDTDSGSGNPDENPTDSEQTETPDPEDGKTDTETPSGSEEGTDVPGETEPEQKPTVDAPSQEEESKDSGNTQGGAGAGGSKPGLVDPEESLPEETFPKETEPEIEKEEDEDAYFIEVTAQQIVAGGLVAQIDGKSLITECFSFMNMGGEEADTLEAEVLAAGFCGFLGEDTRVESSYASGIVDVSGISAGFVGIHAGKLQDCFSTCIMGEHCEEPYAFAGSCLKETGTLNGCIYDRQIACAQDSAAVGENTLRMIGDESRLSGENWHYTENAYPQIAYFANHENETFRLRSSASAIALVLPEDITLSDALTAAETGFALPSEIDGEEIRWSAEGAVTITDDNRAVFYASGSDAIKAPAEKEEESEDLTEETAAPEEPSEETAALPSDESRAEKPDTEHEEEESSPASQEDVQESLNGGGVTEESKAYPDETGMTADELDHTVESELGGSEENAPEMNHTDDSLPSDETVPPDETSNVTLE